LTISNSVLLGANGSQGSYNLGRNVPQPFWSFINTFSKAIRGAKAFKPQPVAGNRPINVFNAMFVGVWARWDQERTPKFVSNFMRQQ